jgi:hypothetical protein
LLHVIPYSVDEVSAWMGGRMRLVRDVALKL